jgi:homopolymeric O-antigen transport system ATP-binding protein
MAAAVRADGLSKLYRIGELHAQLDLRDTLGAALSAPFRRFSRRRGDAPSERTTRRSGDYIWAVKDVSFEVAEGEVFGIVGHNGAGKSTLLKILSRITEPTSGSAIVDGRVGSLLEVGTGFHPELTGRENIFLNGAILGMKRAEIQRKFDEIVSFAEVDRFIDTPIKHYSSGMYLRLAFAVAAHLEPEVLVVDEVLAVGDAAFQKKCLGKMGDVAKSGRTVIFVSHNLAAVRALCDRVLLLDHGREVTCGPAGPVVNQYLERGATASAERTWLLEDAPGDHKSRLCGVRILDPTGRPAVQVDIAEPLEIVIDYAVLVEGTVLNLSIWLTTQEGVYVLASASLTDPDFSQRPHPVGRFRSTCTVPGELLNEGRYNISALLVEEGRIVAQADEVVSVDMTDLGARRGNYFGPWGGVVRPTLQWTTEMTSDSRGESAPGLSAALSTLTFADPESV